MIKGMEIVVENIIEGSNLREPKMHSINLKRITNGMKKWIKSVKDNESRIINVQNESKLIKFNQKEPNWVRQYKV